MGLPPFDEFIAFFDANAPGLLQQSMGLDVIQVEGPPSPEDVQAMLQAVHRASLRASARYTQASLSLYHQWLSEHLG